MSKNNNKNKINERLNSLQQKKEELTTHNGDKGELVNKIMNQDEEVTSLDAIAKELQERREAEAVGENEGYVKDTIYIRKDIYEAFNALCLKRGDKKKHANAAFERYVLEQYRKIQKGN